jgi:hypothetical protein
MTTESARLVQLGTANSTPIQADVTVLGSSVAVLLSADYVLSDPRPPGYPFRPEWTGSAPPLSDDGRTITAGTTLHVLACEATALITAGAATRA